MRKWLIQKEKPGSLIFYEIELYFVKFPLLPFPMNQLATEATKPHEDGGPDSIETVSPDNVIVRFTRESSPGIFVLLNSKPEGVPTERNDTTEEAHVGPSPSPNRHIQHYRHPNSYDRLGSSNNHAW